MTFGTTESKPWVEALPTERAGFAGRTFSRFHIVNAGDSVLTVGEGTEYEARVWRGPLTDDGVPQL